MKNIIIIGLLAVCCLVGCKKFLDEKPDKKLSVPQNLSDLQALLNNVNITAAADPISGEISADDYYVADADFNSLLYQTEQRKYTWEKDHLFEKGADANDWSVIYSLIYLSNTVLEKIAAIERTSQNAVVYDDIMGQAYFFRGKSVFNALQIWSLSYQAATAETAPGVVLRESTDFNEPSERSSVQKSYAKAIDDLTRSARLLSPKLIHPTRPCQQAAFGYLARVFLSMREYDRAFNYSDSCLKVKTALIDFNNLLPSKSFPVDRFSSEVIYESTSKILQIMGNTRARIVPELYNMYDPNDLRKQIYFRNNNNGSFGWKGSFSGAASISSGITTDEQLLIRSECLARAGDLAAAIDDLNTLLVKRYVKGSFIPYTVTSVPSVLKLVLKERRKELLMRGLRWIDLKRLNLEGENISLSRVLNGKNYSLAPNDPKYALEIPEDIVSLSQIPQNVR
ncbi:RagB/SusD family nutrient uptake outer membrane protein [Pedobacter sp. MR2016-19]|uniref:RagB/SusD family nutrient uptake outer membrane protein n=1 Tax=Pedobacter sp. MR2016-19 TaxID=2780089 RepID=UPI0018766DF6|nr:RagB/SusD family nutrient uptake outer membrane protein [Pedobacter sp. MR2016-19]MBE5320070.1 RagB/SusD family nutrient uptake outer membrane protein [Pedobacter sp. MR2016-19]